MGLKTFIGTAIISLGIAGAVFVIQNSATSLNLNSSDRQNSLSASNNSPVSNPQFVEQLKDLSSQSSKNDSQKQGNFSGANLTESFSRSIAQRLVDENPEGIEIINGNKAIIAPNPEQIALELLADAQKKFEAQQILKDINDADIKITDENTKASFISYTEKFDAITSEWRAKIDNPDNQKEFTKENMGAIISAYENVIQKFYDLPVPKLLVNLHKTEIKYLKAELTLLEKINSPEKDPVGSLIASGNFEKIDAEFNQKMNEELQLFFKKANNL